MTDLTKVIVYGPQREIGEKPVSSLHLRPDELEKLLRRAVFVGSIQALVLAVVVSVVLMGVYSELMALVGH